MVVCKIYSMAKHKFLPGNVAAIGRGRPRLSPDEAALRKFTRTKLQGIVQRYIQCTAEELVEVQKDPSLPAIDQLVLRVIVAALEDADTRKIDWLTKHVL